MTEFFEFEYCHECGGDERDHDPVLMDLGDYGTPGCFFRCRPDAVDRTEAP
jgi:hypothetical protein